MGADSYFIQGKSHNICEDYATDGLFNDEQFSYVIICDGCSSSKNTDIGSRILAKVIEKNLFWLMVDKDIQLTSNRYITEANMISQMLNLDIDCLNSTIVLLYKTNKKYIVNMYGDGVIVAKNNNDEYNIFVIDFPSYAPSYLSYHLNSEAFDYYKNNFGIKEYIYNISCDKNFEFTDQSVQELDIQNFNIPLTMEFNIDEYNMVSVFSDGIQTFNKNETNGITKQQKFIGIDEVLKELLNFKNTKGEFVKRRFKRFIKTCQEKNWNNFDDVSMGTII